MICKYEFRLDAVQHSADVNKYNPVLDLPSNSLSWNSSVSEILGKEDWRADGDWSNEQQVWKKRRDHNETTVSGVGPHSFQRVGSSSVI